ncbi:MAG: four-carbon acid sugar kinase family protein [Bacteriovorax sp.]|nr:four-carbon acid sugar kinase family protein [Rhizobacter sp.]
MILGIIADDFTGATDVASMLVRAGMRTVQVIGVPQVPAQLPHGALQRPPEGAHPAWGGPAPDGATVDADAVVIALKTRNVPAAEAVRESLAALRWLQAAGMRQCYFKYCSTFDSTPAGNIGPVTEALMEALGADFTIACPAFPENGRTVFCGHLFVGDELLSDSGMRHHPLTPMTDANLVRVLQAQSRRRVGLLRRDVVARGVVAVLGRIDALRADGIGIAVADAVDNDDLRSLAAACADLPLLTAGSGLALGLPAVYAQRGWLTPDAHAAELDPAGGGAAVLAGSCSLATNAQVQRWQQAGHPAFAIDPRALARGEPVAAQALAWAQSQGAGVPVLVYATSSGEELKTVQAELGAMQAGALVEQCLASIARGLVEYGVRRLVVAGGETSGAVVQALGVTRLRIGAAICPGVPWTQAEGRTDGATLHLALKSGNFGGPEFFDEALRMSARQ